VICAEAGPSNPQEAAGEADVVPGLLRADGDRGNSESFLATLEGKAQLQPPFISSDPRGVSVVTGS
jgi:hypothetical protein